MSERTSVPVPTKVASACVVLALIVLATTALSQGSVTKCIDADGNVTYQDSPCAPGQAGRSVDLPKAETREDTGAWEAAAREARIVPGMPKRWVLRSRGAPAEIRPAREREVATEVWRYSTKNGMLLVGFSGPNVGWVHDGDAAPAPAPAAAVVAVDATHRAQNRRFVIAGRECEHVFAEIGASDRQEPLPPAAAAEGAAKVVPTGKRHIYEPRPGDPQMRTAFSCIDGKVADVERTIVR